MVTSVAHTGGNQCLPPPLRRRRTAHFFPPSRPHTWRTLGEDHREVGVRVPGPLRYDARLRLLHLLAAGRRLPLAGRRLHRWPRQTRRPRGAGELRAAMLRPGRVLRPGPQHGRPAEDGRASCCRVGSGSLCRWPGGVYQERAEAQSEVARGAAGTVSPSEVTQKPMRTQVCRDETLQGVVRELVTPLVNARGQGRIARVRGRRVLSSSRTAAGCDKTAGAPPQRKEQMTPAPTSSKPDFEGRRPLCWRTALSAACAMSAGGSDLADPSLGRFRRIFRTISELWPLPCDTPDLRRWPESSAPTHERSSRMSPAARSVAPARRAAPTLPTGPMAAATCRTAVPIAGRPGSFEGLRGSGLVRHERAPVMRGLRPAPVMKDSPFLSKPGRLEEHLRKSPKTSSGKMPSAEFPGAPHALRASSPRAPPPPRAIPEDDYATMVAAPVSTLAGPPVCGSSSPPRSLRRRWVVAAGGGPEISAALRNSLVALAINCERLPPGVRALRPPAGIAVHKGQVDR